MSTKQQKLIALLEPNLINLCKRAKTASNQILMIDSWEFAYRAGYIDMDNSSVRYMTSVFRPKLKKMLVEAGYKVTAEARASDHFMVTI
jgi:hypothetical protein